MSADDLKNLELGNLVETFREHAMELVNMLDVSVPVVAKLKVLTPPFNVYFFINQPEIN